MTILLVVTTATLMVSAASMGSGGGRSEAAAAAPRRRGSCVESGLCCQHKNNSCRAFATSVWVDDGRSTNDASQDSEGDAAGAVAAAGGDEDGDKKLWKEYEAGCFCDSACGELGDCCYDYAQACKPVDCILADKWDDWSECDVRCGPGVKQRRRQIIQHPLNGGRACGKTVEKAPCEGTKCKVARAPNGAEELSETAFIVPAVFGSYRKSKQLGYDGFSDIRRNLFEHYDSKTAVKRPSYCMEFELTSVRAACNATSEDGSDVTAADQPDQKRWLVKGSMVCVECQTSAMRKKLGSRCRGHGVLLKETRWNAVTVPGCRGRWVLKSRKEECVCSAESSSSYILV